MDLNLNEQQQLLRNAAREFLANECPESHIRDMEDDEQGYSPVLWSQMAEQGWHGLLIPEEYGGVGFDFVDLCVLIEEFGRALVPGPFMPTILGGAVPIMEAGSGEQKAEFLPRLAAGELIFTLALTEPSARFDEAGIATTASVSGDRVTFNGAKLFVPDAHVADYLVVAGRSSEGVTLGIVATDQPGVIVTPLQTIARDKQCEVLLTDAEGQLLGAEGDGWRRLRPVSRSTPSQSVRTSWGSLRWTSRYRWTTRKIASSSGAR